MQGRTAASRERACEATPDTDLLARRALRRALVRAGRLVIASAVVINAFSRRWHLVDLVGEFLPENGGRFSACIVKRDEHPWRHSGDRRHPGFENVHIGSPGPYGGAGRRWSANQGEAAVTDSVVGAEPVSRLEEDALHRTGSIRAPESGQLRGPSRYRASTAFVRP